MTSLARVALVAAATVLPQVTASPSGGAGSAGALRPTGAAVSDSAAAARAHANSLYVSILEKTNQQLGLWTNPYGLIVATLGVLFAIAAIIVALLLFRQTHEYRTALTDSIAKYESILNTLVQDRLQQIQGQVDELLVGARKELETATALQRPTIEKRIQVLEEKRDEILRAELPLAGAGAGMSGRTTRSFGGLLGDRRICTTCGRELALPEPPDLMAVTGEHQVYCAHCGTRNLV